MRLLSVLLLVSAPAWAGRAKAPPPDLEEVASELLGRALTSNEAYEELRTLCDTIGHRLSGSPQLDEAIAWAADALAEDGLTVRKEPVTIPKWVRGEGHGAILSPVADELAVLALGGSIATPEGGVEADVLVVTSFEDLDARANEAAGRIVVYDVPFTTYGDTVKYRYAGASRAATHGAVGALVRSISPTSLYTPHTGVQKYAEDVPPIPVAAIALEDATRLARIQASGVTPRVRFTLTASDQGTAPSHNVVGERKGRSKPDEIVVLGCHLDSWDVGQGAQDDGAGCVTVMEAAAQLAALPVAPKRTVRVVLYTNEENGVAGGKAYAEAHAGERIVAALEDDSGAGTPFGFRIDARAEDGTFDTDKARAFARRLAPYAAWFAPIEATRFEPGFAGTDIGPLMDDDTVGLGLWHDTTDYWPIHHTEADTFDKVDPDLVKRNVAATTVMAWLLAEGDLVGAP